MKRLVGVSVGKYLSIKGKGVLRSAGEYLIKKITRATNNDADQGYVDLEKNIGYKYIPKVATTTILHALYEMRNGTPFKVKGKVRIHRWARRNSSNLQSVKSFIVVRDPVKRFLSSYSNRVLHHRELSEEFIRRRHPELIGAFTYDPELSEFINNFEAYRKVSVIDHHSKPLVEHLDGLQLSFFDQVYPIENIKSLEAELNRVYGTCVKFKKHQASGVKKIGVSKLDETQLLTLLEIFDEDYVLLQDYYSKDDLYAEWQRGRER